MPFKPGDLVYEAKDPLRHVGTFIQPTERRRAWVRWHGAYKSAVPLAGLVIAPAGYAEGSKVKED